jgi:hypothetical protein
MKKVIIVLILCVVFVFGVAVGASGAVNGYRKTLSLTSW